MVHAVLYRPGLRQQRQPTCCWLLGATRQRGFATSWSWAPRCAIGAAERDDIESAARQAQRVLDKKEDIFQKAAIDDADEVEALRTVRAQTEERLQTELAASAERADSDGSEPTTGVGELQNRIRQTFRMLEEGLIERDAESRLLVLATLCGEHLLLLGPPGTAKSALCRQLSQALHAPYFERQLTRFSVPEELFGPLCKCCV